jgi:hypothetical protein
MPNGHPANHMLPSDQNLFTMYFGSPNLGLYSQSLKGMAMGSCVGGVESRPHRLRLQINLEC